MKGALWGCVGFQQAGTKAEHLTEGSVVSKSAGLLPRVGWQSNDAQVRLYRGALRGIYYLIHAAKNVSNMTGSPIASKSLRCMLSSDKEILYFPKVLTTLRETQRRGMHVAETIPNKGDTTRRLRVGCLRSKPSASACIAGWVLEPSARRRRSKESSSAFLFVGRNHRCTFPAGTVGYSSPINTDPAYPTQ